MTFGTITNVEQRPLGSALIVDSPAGSTTLTVDFTSDFDEDGGQLQINGFTRDYTDMDSETGVITLAAPLVNDAVTDDPILVVESGTVSVEWIANVATDEGDTIPAIIPTALISYFPEGSPTENTSVEIRLRDGGTYEVTSQPQTTPSFDGASVWNPFAFRDIDTATIPDSTYTQVTGWVAGGEWNGIDAADGYTVTYPGIYFVAVQAAFNANPNGARRVRIMKNGAQVAYMAQAGDSGTLTYVATSTELRCAELDVITVEVWQNSGAGLALAAGVGVSNFKMHRVSV